jgi:thiosulfate reductase cytochrome b subunit
MAEATVVAEAATEDEGHRRWVRISHWVIAFSIITLGISGVFVLAVHPRLYWGEVGNDLVPAILEIPISANHQPEGWQRTVEFTEVSNTAFSANRTYPIFNQNGWARSLHFLAAWFFLVAGFIYALAGFVSGHARRSLLPKSGDFSFANLKKDVMEHIKPRPGAIGAGPPYGIVQRISYGIVLYVAMPLMVITGLAMAPAITAALPILLDIFGGYQSARTVHFFSFAVLLLFFIVHVAMVFITGFGRQMHAMIVGK